MRVSLLVLLLGLYFTINVSAQVADTAYDVAASKARRWENTGKILKRVGVPLTLVGVGLLGRQEGNMVCEAKEGVQARMRSAFPRFTAYGLDDYSRYAPLAMAYAMMATGRRGERTPVAFTLIYLMGHELDATVVSNLKRETAESRPYDASLRNSFPSSHTSQAFLTATLLHEQYGRQYPWLSVSGYAVATATGAMRVLGNRHWVTDVLAGGAIGFLSAEAAWHIYPPLTRLLPDKLAHKLLLVPTYMPGGAGLLLAVQQ